MENARGQRLSSTVLSFFFNTFFILKSSFQNNLKFHNYKCFPCAYVPLLRPTAARPTLAMASWTRAGPWRGVASLQAGEHTEPAGHEKLYSHRAVRFLPVSEGWTGNRGEGGAVSWWHQTRDRKEQLSQLSSGHEERGDDPSPGTSWFFRSLNRVLVFNDFNSINSKKNNNTS